MPADLIPFMMNSEPMPTGELTERMLDLLNEGVAGCAIHELVAVAQGMMMVTNNQAARKVGMMLIEMVRLNQEYTAYPGLVAGEDADPRASLV